MSQVYLIKQLLSCYICHSYVFACVTVVHKSTGRFFPTHFSDENFVALCTNLPNEFFSYNWRSNSGQLATVNLTTLTKFNRRSSLYFPVHTRLLRYPNYFRADHNKQRLVEADYDDDDNNGNNNNDNDNL